MAQPTKHPASIDLEHCWICEERFTEFGGPPGNFKHHHHIIPRSSGGVDGPTVSIDDSHHTAVHRIAERMWSNKPHFEFLTRSKAANKRLLQLAIHIVEARAATEKDPNKVVMVPFTPSPERLRQLTELKKVYGGSRQKILDIAVANLHKKHFL